jgi:hypothetical protein
MEEVKETSGQPDQVAGGDAQENGDKVSHVSYLEAVKEKKGWQAKARAAEAKLRELEEKELAQSNQFKELADKKAKEAGEWKQKFEGATKKYAYTIFEQAAKSEALKMGANEKALEALIKAGDWSNVEIDYENMSVNGEQLKQALADMSKKYDFFFSKKASAPRDVQVGNNSPVGKSLSELSTSEIEKILKSGAYKD